MRRTSVAMNFSVIRVCVPDAVIEREPPISLDEWLAFIRSIGSGGPYREPYRARVAIGATLRSPELESHEL